MNIAVFCVFISSVLPVVFAGYAKVTGGFKTGKHNSNARDFMAGLEGKPYRAKCAHDNSWEAFAPFAASVILALHFGVAQNLIDSIAVAFIVFRLLYGYFYIIDKHLLRSATYFLALACSISLFMMAAFH